MRKWAGLLLIVALMMIACSSADEATPSGTSFNVAVGDSFTVKLESNASTGYVWVLDDLPAAIVTLSSETYRQPSSSRVGAAGMQEFIFEATGPGSTTIEMTYVRPFDDPPNPADRTAFPVTVTG